MDFTLAEKLIGRKNCCSVVMCCAPEGLLKKEIALVVDYLSWDMGCERRASRRIVGIQKGICRLA